MDRDREIPAHDESAVAVLLQKEEARRALHVGQGLRRRLLEEMEPLAAHDAKFEIPHELLVMHLADAQKIKHILASIIQNLNLRRFLMEEDLRTPAEWLTVAAVLRDERDDGLRDLVFAAYVG
jgi:hypothetical protein